MTDHFVMEVVWPDGSGSVVTAPPEEVLGPVAPTVVPGHVADWLAVISEHHDIGAERLFWALHGAEDPWVREAFRRMMRAASA
jgi:hypothetical protein